MWLIVVTCSNYTHFLAFMLWRSKLLMWCGQRDAKCGRRRSPLCPKIMREMGVLRTSSVQPTDSAIALQNKDVLDLDVIFELYVNDVVLRSHNSPESATWLKFFVNRAIHRREDSVVYKLLPISDEDDRIILYKLYVEVYKTQSSAFDGAGSAKFIEKSIIWEILRDMRTKSMSIEGKYFWWSNWRESTAPIPCSTSYALNEKRIQCLPCIKHKHCHWYIPKICSTAPRWIELSVKSNDARWTEDRL